MSFIQQVFILFVIAYIIRFLIKNNLTELFFSNLKKDFVIVKEKSIIITTKIKNWTILFYEKIKNKFFKKEELGS